MLNLLKIQLMFEKKGYCIIPNVFNVNVVDEMNKEIASINDADIYLDSKGSLRRIERFYNKTKYLNQAHLECVKVLKEKFNSNFSIFKDKYNAKPPGGEGFFSHFDGVFIFKDSADKERRGWYEYSDYFINILIALDPCNLENGTLQIANSINLNFNELMELTKKNGTPDLNEDFEKTLLFEPVILNKGDMVLFLNTCPHKSTKNKSLNDRRTLYYTYTKGDSSYYNEYFSDKLSSKNDTSKSLSGEI